ncbi:MAG: hypothetical protein AAF213_01865 [Pseudomonadota bacterium]
MAPDCLPPPAANNQANEPTNTPASTAANTADSAPDQSLGFRDVEEAWFWFMAAYEARQSGAKIVAGVGALPRPCEPLDILRVVDRLYRQRRLYIDHLRVLNFYGKRRSPPDPRRDQERKAYGIWHEALARIEPALRRKGIMQ